MKFIDSNVIAYAFYDNKYKVRCREIIEIGGVTNTINIIEAYNIIQFEANREHATMSIKSLLKSNINIVDVDINLVFEALKAAHKYKKLKFIDLIHYITALVYDCNEIASYDNDFDNLSIRRVT